MSGIQFAAVLLACAMLTAPPRPRWRLAVVRPRAARSPWAAVAVAAGSAMAALVFLVPPSVILVLLVAAGTVAARVQRMRGQCRRRREGEALASALDILVGELRVGAHPAAAFETAGKEAGGPVGCALRAVATRVRLGADAAEGIRAVAADSATPAYWNRLAVFWQLAAAHGLAMSDLMRAAHRDIVDRQRFADRMHAALAGARATAAILAGLPLLGVLLGQMIGAHPLRFLLGGGLGGVLLLIGVGLICVGVLWADRIVGRMAA